MDFRGIVVTNYSKQLVIARVMRCYCLYLFKYNYFFYFFKCDCSIRKVAGGRGRKSADVRVARTARERPKKKKESTKKKVFYS